MMKRPETILMDVDGTMTDTRTSGNIMEQSPFQHLVRLVVQHKGLSEKDAERLILSCGDPAVHCLSVFLPVLGIDPDEYFSAIREDLKQHISIPEDVIVFLKTMKKKGIRVCAATTNSRFMTLAKLSVAGLADRNGCAYLAAYHAGNEFGDPEGKFSERYFPNILRHHGYDLETTMMIGDEPEHDLYPALKAGIRHCVILDRKQTEDMVRKEGGIFVRDLGVVNAVLST